MRAAGPVNIFGRITFSMIPALEYRIIFKIIYAVVVGVIL